MSDSPQRRITNYPTVDEQEPTGGHEVVRFDLDHEVILSRSRDGWEADCWILDDDGHRIGRCRGWAFQDGPCAHLWAARSHVAHQRLEDDDARHDHHVERAMADGGHHHAKEERR